MSADGRIWICGNDRTEDYGFLWTRCENLPTGASVVADRTSPNRFYALDPQSGTLYTSVDGAKTFRSKPLALPLTGEDALYASPRRSGDLWIAGTDGLYHASPARPFAKLPRVTEIHAFGLGPDAPGTGAPILFVAGKVDGESGIFRSDDFAQTWLHLNGPSPSITVSVIHPDPRRIGRVYLTCGDGLFCGDPR